MESNKRINLRVVVHTILMILLLSSAGCNNHLPDRTYKEYTVDEGNVHFSFEYSENYTLGVYDFENESRKYINFFGPNMDFQEQSVIQLKQARISIDLYKQDETVSGAESELQKQIEANEKYPGFRIIQRYSTKIDGITAIVLNYSNSGQGHDYSGVVTFAFSSVDWSLYFEHDSYVWWIQFDYPIEMTKEAKADFDHMLKTFKILE
jgi:hypothetical protein